MGDISLELCNLGHHLLCHFVRHDEVAILIEGYRYPFPDTRALDRTSLAPACSQYLHCVRGCLARIGHTERSEASLSHREIISSVISGDGPRSSLIAHLDRAARSRETPAFPQLRQAIAPWKRRPFRAVLKIVLRGAFSSGVSSCVSQVLPQIYPEKQISSVVPIGRRGDEVNQACHSKYKMTEEHLGRSVMEPKMKMRNGGWVLQPKEWATV
jgi:hypothetical protein